MHACRAAGGLVMLQSEDTQGSSGGLGLKSQIGVNARLLSKRFRGAHPNTPSIEKKLK